MSANYQIVKLASGAHSVRSLEYKETFHPVVGPVAEVESLYIQQLDLLRRITSTSGEFVIWDVGLGAGGNPLVLLNNLPAHSGEIRIVSFDRTLEPLIFALQHPNELPFIRGWEFQLATLAEHRMTSLTTPSGVRVHWQVHLGEFPEIISAAAAAALPKPNVVFYDAYSPATNPEMWTVDIFSRIFELLDPARPCAMPTYSRSTMLRVTLLLAGFYVGRGHATGEKEETTIAANAQGLISDPLDDQWLARAKRSTSAEPLLGPSYRQAPISEVTWALLRVHPQFKSGTLA